MRLEASATAAEHAEATESRPPVNGSASDNGRVHRPRSESRCCSRITRTRGSPGAL